MRTHPSERGVALIAVLLLLMLASAVLAGFASVIMNEQRLQSVEQGRAEAFYAAHGGLEAVLAKAEQAWAWSAELSRSQAAPA